MDTEERVSELENRVGYLERELELSYAAEKFERDINRYFNDAEIEISEGHWGHHAVVTDIDGDDVQMAINRLDNNDNLEYTVTETGAGLGMEVWTGEP